MPDTAAPSDLASTATTRCCVVGGGPAGMMLSLILARAGVPVTLLESHLDFDRDFRGDTVHPSTLEILDQLDLADKVLALPHAKVQLFRLFTRGGITTVADFHRLRTKFPYMMVLPQVRMLDLLAKEAAAFPMFVLKMGANVQRLVRDDGTVRGVQYRDNENRWHEVRADLTVAADGRFSKLRHLAEVPMASTSPPMDVVWFRLPRHSSDATEDAGLRFYINAGHFVVVLDRGTEWQLGYVILKGTFAAVRTAGLEALRQGLADAVPWLADRTDHLRDWKQVAVLNVESTRALRWHQPGLLLIGDAAHAMSPVGGVGINVAVQDAVAAANVLTVPLQQNRVTEADLAKVQVLREPAVKLVQRVQGFVQKRIAAPSLNPKAGFTLPWFVRLMLRIPGLRNLPAKFIAFGPQQVKLQASILGKKT